MSETQIQKINPVAPESAAIAEAARLIRAGGLVAFPTETVYGLGANALDARAVERIFFAKGRPANNPIIVHISDTTELSQVVADWPEAARRLAARFWPGPLTLVVQRAVTLPEIVTAGAPTLAVRMPAHPVAFALIRAAGVPLAAPSANRSGELSPTTAEHVLRSLSGRIDMILDGGPTRIGVESTVLDLSTTPPRLLRPGHVSPAEIEGIIGPIERHTIIDGPTPLPSPGLLDRHYAPRTPMECLRESALRVSECVRQGEKAGWLTFDARPEIDAAAVVMPRHADEYAARLYAELHALDQMGLDRIIVEMPPDEEAWLAVRDRLRRASSRT